MKLSYEERDALIRLLMNTMRSMTKEDEAKRYSDEFVKYKSIHSKLSITQALHYMDEVYAKHIPVNKGVDNSNID